MTEHQIIRTNENQHDIYLLDRIDTTMHGFVDMLDLLRSAKQWDEITIHINSGGGCAYDTFQFLDAMSQSKAKITTRIEGWCASAATFVFLAGHVREVADHSTMMFHDFSSGTSGKSNEMLSAIVGMQASLHAAFDTICKGFLTPTEMLDVKSGKDLWLTTAQIKTRLG